MPAPVVMWFRRDLRLADNPALAAAAAAGAVIPLFVVDPVFFRTGAWARQMFLVDNLRALGASIGRRLVLRHGPPEDVIARLVDETGACEVFAGADFGPYGRRRDVKVAGVLAAAGVPFTRVGSPYAVDPGTVVKSDGTSYAVFTPFRRAWEARGWARPTVAPDVDWLGDPDVPCEGYPIVHRTRSGNDRPAGSYRNEFGEGPALPAAGEAAAAALLDAFLDERIDGYEAARNLPGVEGTSRLSPYLRFGLLHPRQVLAELGDSPAHAAFRSELCWREFYADVLFRHPDSAWAPLRPELAGLAADRGFEADARFAAWCAGQTGFPIVDAGMRQLLATGWMHNRVRMITASFLVKDLHLPWQWGARHFMCHLADGDLASNNHGWQWTAGTGTDAAPYYRVFNPTLQGERFDPDGAYVRRWVPELAGLPDRLVHEPTRAGHGPPLGYPAPMVDHAAERAEALARYAAVRRQG